MILTCTNYYCDGSYILILNSSTPFAIISWNFTVRKDPLCTPIYLLSVLTYEFLFYLKGCNLLFSLIFFHAWIIIIWSPFKMVRVSFWYALIIFLSTYFFLPNKTFQVHIALFLRALKSAISPRNSVSFK